MSDVGRQRETQAPLHVMHVVNFLYDGGTEAYIHTLATRMDRGRYRFSICCLVEAGFGADRFRKAGIPLRVLSVRRGGGLRNRMRNGIEIFRLARLMRTMKVDIIHSHDNHPAGYARLAAMLARVPVVYVTYHNLYYWLSPRSHLMNRLLARVTTRIIAVSLAARDYSMENDCIPADKYRVVYNGIDCEDAGEAGALRRKYRAEFGIPPDAFVVGNIASLSERKGQVLLAAAMGRLAEIHPRPWLVIVGSERDDEPGIRSQIEDAAYNSGIADCLRFTGSRSDARGMLHMFDLFVLPSLTEGFGYALVEAMCAGVPAIVSDIPALAEVAGQGEHALLFQSGSSADLAGKLVYASRQPERMNAMTRAAKRAVLKNFTLAKMVQGYEAVYREDVERRIGRERADGREDR